MPHLWVAHMQVSADGPQQDDRALPDLVIPCIICLSSALEMLLDQGQQGTGHLVPMRIHNGHACNMAVSV